MSRVNGSAGTRRIAADIHTQPIVGRKGGRRIKRAHGIAHCPFKPSCCPKRPLVSYSCIQEVLRDLPSARNRRSLPQHIPLSERKAMLQERRNSGL